MQLNSIACMVRPIVSIMIGQVHEPHVFVDQSFVHLSSLCIGWYAWWCICMSHVYISFVIVNRPGICHVHSRSSCHLVAIVHM